MFSLEATLTSVWDFVKKLLKTFWHSIARSYLFLSSLAKKEGSYLSYKTYLFLCLFIGYVFYAAEKKSWFYSPNLIQYKETVKELSGLSILDMIIRAAPLSLLVYCVVWLLTKIFFIEKKWRRFIIESSVIWYGSYLLLRCSITLLFLLISLFVGEDAESLEGRGSFIKIIVTGAYYLAPVFVMIGILAPFSGISKGFYRSNRKLFIKFASILTSIILLFIFLEPYALIAKTSELVSLEINKDRSKEKLALYSYLPQDNAVKITSSSQGDSITNLTCTITLVNNSNQDYYLERAGEWSLDVAIAKAGDNCVASSSPAISFFVDKWYHDESLPVLYIKPGDNTVIKLIGKTTAENLSSFKKEIKNTCYTVWLNSPVMDFFKETGISSKPGVSTYVFPVKVVFE